MCRIKNYKRKILLGAEKIFRFMECPLHDCPIYKDFSIRV